MSSVFYVQCISIRYMTGYYWLVSFDMSSRTNETENDTGERLCYLKITSKDMH